MPADRQTDSLDPADYGTGEKRASCFLVASEWCIGDTITMMTNKTGCERNAFPPRLKLTKSDLENAAKSQNRRVPVNILSNINDRQFLTEYYRLTSGVNLCSPV